jgi:tetratricopeptide (TPR) repeat protein
MKHQTHIWKLALRVACCVLALGAVTAFADSSPTPRALFNDGTTKLREGKLREAETALQSAVAAQSDALQPLALYNLGHVRFQQGTNILKEIADKAALQRRGDNATSSGSKAMQAIDTALGSTTPDLEGILRAYLDGRGARRDLKDATNAIARAMTQFGAVLIRWQRASGDFKSADELQPRDDAKFNADVIDRRIAELIDQMQQMQQQQQAMSQQRQELLQKMKQLRGKIPGDMPMPEGMSGEEEEEEDGKSGEEQMAEKQGPQREGKEMEISPEDAMRLLETLKLDTNRKLPLGFDQQSEPKTKSGKVW